MLSAGHGSAQALDVWARIVFGKGIFSHISYFCVALNVLIAWCSSKHDEVRIQIQLSLFALGGNNVEYQPLKYRLGGRGGFSLLDEGIFFLILSGNMI